MIAASSSSILAIVLSCAAAAPAPGAVELRTGPSFRCVVMEFAASEDVSGERIGAFVAAVRAQGLGSRVSGSLFAVRFNFPLLEPGRRDAWGLGLRLDESEVKVAEPLKILDYGFPAVAALTYHGPFETANNGWNEMVRTIEEKGWQVTGPPLEIWVGDPARDRPEDLETQLVVPVQVPNVRCCTEKDAPPPVVGTAGGPERKETQR